MCVKSIKMNNLTIYLYDWCYFSPVYLKYKDVRNQILHLLLGSLVEEANIQVKTTTSTTLENKAINTVVNFSNIIK